MRIIKAKYKDGKIHATVRLRTAKEREIFESGEYAISLIKTEDGGLKVELRRVLGK